MTDDLHDEDDEWQIDLTIHRSYTLPDIFEDRHAVQRYVEQVEGTRKHDSMDVEIERL